MSFALVNYSLTIGILDLCVNSIGKIKLVDEDGGVGVSWAALNPLLDRLTVN